VVSLNPGSVEELFHGVFAEADARLGSHHPALRRIGRVDALCRSESARGAELLERALGGALAGTTGGRTPFRFDVLDDAGASSRQPDLWTWVEEEGGDRAHGAKAHWHVAGCRLLASGDTHSLAAFDPHARRAVMWYRDVDAVPGFERAAPVRDLLHWMHAEGGAHLLHGAAVGSEAGGVLIVGPGGRGKSTLATTALLRGLRFAGDDYVVVDAAARTAYGVYLSVKVHVDDAPRYAARFRDAPTTPCGTDEKVALFIGEPPLGFSQGIPLVAVAVPAIDAPFLGWRPLPKARALAALAPSTLFQTSGRREATFAACSELVRALPSVVWNPGPLDPTYPERVVAGLDAIARYGAAA
jgi:hypothetical protein